MRHNKWDGLKIAATGLPFLFLLAYLTGLVIPLPAFLLPERRYLAFGRGTEIEELRNARGSAREAFLVLPDRLLPLPSAAAPASAYERVLDLLPDEPSLAPFLGELGAGIPPLRRARLEAGFTPGAEELSALSTISRESGLPLAITVRARAREFPLESLSYRRSAAERRLSFELLFSPEARSSANIEVVALRGPERGPPSAAEGLWSGGGSELPDDFALRLSAERKELSGIEVSLVMAGKKTTRSYELAAGLDEEPRVLVVSQKEGATSFVESLYPAERLGLAAAENKDLHAYELVVIDGLPLAALEGRFKASLLELAAKRTGSLLFAADSPDFGKKGDNPEIEALLPVSLLPRSLKDLPDLALLIMIDTSGSMFGDKLSLAKVTGLELLRSLKPTDVVGMMLFSDERSWVYDFQLNRNIVAAPLLEPVSAGGGTDLAPALTEGLERLGRESLKEKHLVLVTDGVTRPADFQALAEKARVLGISISTMGVGEDLNRALLERLALQAGGRFYRVNSADEIPSLLFEDRKSTARPPFAQGSIPVLALSGERVATIGGMAQYAAAESATVLFTNDLGDPLFASREYGNRAVMLFASDLYGGYTADFFARSATAGAIKDRLDALFAERPLEVALQEDSRGVTVLLRSDSLAAPGLLLSRSDAESVEVDFRRAGPELWAARAILPIHGRWRASILDRASAVSSFPLAVNGGLQGVEVEAARALADWRPLRARRVSIDAIWLGLFFLASLGATIVLRIRR